MVEKQLGQTSQCIHILLHSINACLELSSFITNCTRKTHTHTHTHTNVCSHITTTTDSFTYICIHLPLIFCEYPSSSDINSTSSFNDILMQQFTITIPTLQKQALLTFAWSPKQYSTGATKNSVICIGCLPADSV